ncbi:hypothetical protein [Achromobacter sp.]|uniref:hypothetical protein n=1 Tax=Achromobacter sp. TaxID=134375 RepID=UPI0028AC8A04|nr:hypothetical protein [Achromobacter sp.]
MKTLTAAGLLLAFLLGGCAPMGSSRSEKPQQSSSMHPDPANYHHTNFGEPNNEPFQGNSPGH